MIIDTRELFASLRALQQWAEKRGMRIVSVTADPRSTKVAFYSPDDRVSADDINLQPLAEYSIPAGWYTLELLEAIESNLSFWRDWIKVCREEDAPVFSLHLQRVSRSIPPLRDQLDRLRIIPGGGGSCWPLYPFDLPEGARENRKEGWRVFENHSRGREFPVLLESGEVVLYYRPTRTNL